MKICFYFLIVISLVMMVPRGAQGDPPKKETPGKAMHASPVERGRYLTTISGCNDCHSPKKMTPQGPVPDEALLLSGHPAAEKIPEIPKDVLGMPPEHWAALGNAHFTAWVGFWGVSYAANLTPDTETGLGSWTPEMFIKAMRTGKHMGEGRPILPPMPWPNFAQMTDEDLQAIF
ncbi:MAG TPA: diheme cytochrome c-553, partial [Acidobacteriota bacterium]|nr:diheme cytochrome c-553 [Acidobacteriota bacterium]